MCCQEARLDGAAEVVGGALARRDRVHLRRRRGAGGEGGRFGESAAHSGQRGPVSKSEQTGAGGGAARRDGAVVGAAGEELEAAVEAEVVHHAAVGGEAPHLRNVFQHAAQKAERRGERRAQRSRRGPSEPWRVTLAAQGPLGQPARGAFAERLAAAAGSACRRGLSLRAGTGAGCRPRGLHASAPELSKSTTAPECVPMATSPGPDAMQLAASPGKRADGAQASVSLCQASLHSSY